MSIKVSRFTQQLPLVAEEGGFCTSVSRQTLIDALSENSTTTAGEVALQLIERLFDGLSLLDSESLANGNWRFVSFSASLMARSLLQLLTDQDSRWLEKPFWLADQPEPIQGQQRQILHELETRRVQLHRAQAASPIRYVHVAWAFIKLAGRILLHHREDKSRLDVANYVPIGGKLHLCDFDESLSQSEALTLLQSPAGSPVFHTLPMTLKREVLEETGLRYGEHYQFSEWKMLPTYRKVEGAGSRHAYTEYQIVIYQVQLTRAGFLMLMQRIDSVSALVWFSPVELAQGYRSDGKKAFVDALYSAWQSETGELSTDLADLPDSFCDEMPTPCLTDPITLPVNDSVFWVGKTGGEKAYRHELDEEERLLLLALGWHRRGLPWENLQEYVSVTAYGWLIVNDPHLNAKLLVLAEKLVKENIPLIECAENVGVRLALPQENVFFAESLFQVRIHQQSHSTGIQLETASMATPLGTLKAIELFISLSPKLTHELAEVAKGQVYQAENPNLPGLVRREIEKLTQLLGLRKLMRQGHGKFELTVTFKEINEKE
jgi:hypothetical protein